MPLAAEDEIFWWKARTEGSESKDGGVSEQARRSGPCVSASRSLPAGESRARARGDPTHLQHHQHSRIINISLSTEVYSPSFLLFQKRKRKEKIQSLPPPPQCDSQWDPWEHVTFATGVMHLGSEHTHTLVSLYIHTCWDLAWLLDQATPTNK